MAVIEQLDGFTTASVQLECQITAGTVWRQLTSHWYDRFGLDVLYAYVPGSSLTCSDSGGRCACFVIGKFVLHILLRLKLPNFPLVG